MKILSRILIGLVVLVAALFLMRNAIAKIAIEKGVHAATGMNLGVGSIDLDFGKTFVRAKDIQLFNPGNYREKVMVELPELYANYDLPGFFKGKVHLEDLAIDLKEVIVIRNEKGELNLNSLKPVKKAQTEKETSKPAAAKPAAGEARQGRPAGKAPALQIDRFHLKIGRVVFRDYSMFGSTLTKDFNVNIDKHYTNITDPNALVSLILVEALRNTTIGSLANFNFDSLKGMTGDVYEMSKKAAEDAMLQAQQGLTGVTEAITSPVETVQKTTGALTETTKDLTSNLRKIKLPFTKEDQ
ncbi:MAG: hypothetical protein HY582_00660 [Candidatus Omnitrophica bacterium]|nr:hypothetical protein [Candidatus Omnitrophota bacterium]